VGYFLQIAHFEQDFERLTGAGVNFEESPRSEPFGRVAVFTDLYGNRWDLVEQRR
jgi:uncharacterized glyoxalase superfamily protein PhnB